MSCLDEIERLFNRLKELDEGNEKRTLEEQEEVKKILHLLQKINQWHPEAIEEYYKNEWTRDPAPF